MKKLLRKWTFECDDTILYFKNYILTRDDIDNIFIKVAAWMAVKYGKSIQMLELSDTKGYWKDKFPVMTDNGPCYYTYTYYDNPRDSGGRFQSTTISWEILKEWEKMTSCGLLKSDWKMTEVPAPDYNGNLPTMPKLYNPENWKYKFEPITTTNKTQWLSGDDSN